MIKILRGEEGKGRKDDAKGKPVKDNDGIWLQRKDHSKATMWSQPKKRERGGKRKAVEANSLQMQRVDVDLTDRKMK